MLRRTHDGCFWGVRVKPRGWGVIGMRNLLSRMGRFLRQVWSELRKVVWPTRRQAVVFTGVVFLSVAMVALMIWIVDSIVTKVLSLVIDVGS